MQKALHLLKIMHGELGKLSNVLFSNFDGDHLDCQVGCDVVLNALFVCFANVDSAKSCKVCTTCNAICIDVASINRFGTSMQGSKCNMQNACSEDPFNVTHRLLHLEGTTIKIQFNCYDSSLMINHKFRYARGKHLNDMQGWTICRWGVEQRNNDIRVVMSVTLKREE